MSVRQAQAQIDAAEFTEWMAYYSLEPWGEERGDLRAGIIASTLANVHRGKGGKPFRPADFMPQYDRPPRRRQTPAEIKQIFTLFTIAAGGEITHAEA